MLFPLTGLATSQIGDLLIYQGDTLLLHTNPLEQYLNSKTERAINDFPLEWTSTACYRGYKATWLLSNDSLYLICLQKGCFSGTPEFFNLKQEFGANRVFARWFTGKGIVPKGKLLRYVHSGYDSYFEKELVLTFNKGILEEEVEHDNSNFYISGFSQHPDSLYQFIYSNINWNKIPDLKEDKIRVFISLQSGESKKPDSISLAMGSEIDILNEEALRVMRLLPEWDVYYRQGKVFPMKWAIPVVFSEATRKTFAAP